MKMRRCLALVSISLAVHAALVLAVGGMLNRPGSTVKPIEIELAHTVQAPSAAQGSTAPALPAQDHSEPASAVTPEPTAGPVKPRPKPRPAPKRTAVAAPAPAARVNTAAAVPETSGSSLPAEAIAPLNETAGTANILAAGSAAPEPGGAARKQEASVLQAWLAAIRARIETAKRYPFAAEERSMQGFVAVSFRLSPEGLLLGAPALVTSSGFSILDKAALQAVQQAAPFPRFPGPAKDMPEGPLSVELKFTLR